MTNTELLSPQALLEHWQGHRRLTRRTIEAFSDEAYREHHPQGMRPFAEMVEEMLMIAEYTVNGLIRNDWPDPSQAEEEAPDLSRAAQLARWDALTERMDAELPGVPPQRYAEHKELAWGGKTVLGWALYAIDNEIHHRAQGYVYLRELGIEPPPFWER